MKLKKRQFARLKDIAEEVNTSGMFGLGGVKLNKLIADIESVQKVKTIREKPLSREMYERPTDFIERIYDQHREDVENDFIRQGASSSDPNIPFTRGLRDAVESVIKPNEISDFLDEALVLSNKEPKIGDVGFFWGEPLTFVYYGRLIDIITKNGVEYVTSTGTYSNFSKTPPELR